MYPKRRQYITLIFGIAFVASMLARAQEPGASANDANAELLKTVQSMQRQIEQLQAAVSELREQSETYRRETESLRAFVQRSGVSAPAQAQTGVPGAQDAFAPPGPAPSQVSTEDQLKLLTAKVNDQYQTKVESGSRYRVKLSGLILLNTFRNRGTVDSIDAPAVAEPQGPLFGRGAFGSSLRQSQIGIEVFGPTWANAKVSGDLRFDFAGGFPDTSNGVTLGLMRLRTGTIRLDWPKTTVVAGQDAPFFSPLSPTSLAQLAEPSFSDAGNLWTWVPQIRVERRIDLSSRNSVVVQGGILDSLTGEPPQAQAERLPHAGEVSRQPAYAARFAWRRGNADNAATIGVSGLYARQDWGFNRTVDGWAGTADWDIPITSRFALSGEFYRGRALGGFGASTYHSVLSTGVLNDFQAQVRGLDTIGGWAQLKFHATSTLQFNAVVGEDAPYASELRQFSAIQNLIDPQLGKNQALMFNFIYRPRSNLLFSTEYRHINSVRLNQNQLSAEHVNMSIGVLF